MIEQIQLPLAVLSYGRAASVLIAHNIGKKINVLPTYVQDLNDVGQLNHCHLVKDCNHWKQRIFAVRTPLDAVLSFVLARTTNVYHITVNETTVIQPQYVDVAQFENLATSCYYWYNFYSTRIQPNDLVVDYDQLNEQINQSNQRYQQTYSDKKNLILNYNEAVDFFQPRLESTVPMYQRFLDHNNLFDIYQIIAE